MDPKLARYQDNWTLLQELLRQKYPHLTGDDLLWRAGSGSDPLDRIAARTAQSRDELERWLDEAVSASARAGNVPVTRQENEERLGNPPDHGDVSSDPDRTRRSGVA